MIQKWAILRSVEAIQNYKKVLEQREQDGVSFLPVTENDAIRLFEYWYIIANEFPYDAVADVHHLLIPRRDNVLGWTDLNTRELHELLHLRETYCKENYEMIAENMPSTKTVQNHFHLHLFVFKRREL